MFNIMNFEEPLSIIKNITTIIKGYHKKLETTGFSGVNPILYQEIEKDIKLIETFKIKTDDLFTYYTDMYNLMLKVENIINIFGNFSIEYYDEGSYTSSGETITKQFITEMKKLFTKLNDMKVDMFDKWELSGIYEHVLERTSLDEINKVYKQHYKSGTGHLIINLYKFLLEKFLKNKENVKNIMDKVEFLKTDILNVDVNTKNKNQTNPIQQTLQWHSFVPSSISKPLSKLFDHSLEKEILMSNKQIGFVIIYKSIKDCLENDFWTMTDKKYVIDNDMYQDYNVGLNEKTIKRSNTIIPRDGKNKNTIEIMNPNADNFYVLDTLDSENYRILHMYNNPTSFLIQKKYIPTTYSKRIYNYNTIINSEITKHIKPPFVSMDYIDRFELSKLENKVKRIRNKIYSNLKKDKLSEYHISNVIRSQIEITVDDGYRYAEIQASIAKELDKLSRNIYKNIDIKNYETTTKNALERYITSRNNIFVTISLKEDILNSTFK